MPHRWIDEGLRHAKEQAEQRRLADERRLREVAVVEEQGPTMMRALVAAIGATLDEYRSKAGVDGPLIDFEELPHQGFLITCSGPPRVDLQCRPSYGERVVHCNLTRSADHYGEAVERPFNIELSVDASDHLVLRHASTILNTVDEAVEFLLAPVLVPHLHPKA